MIIPTDEEVRAAFAEITKDGPMAEATLKLGMLATRNPILKGFIDRTAPSTILDRSVVMAALIAGMNYGLRIGEARAKCEGQK